MLPRVCRRHNLAKAVVSLAIAAGSNLLETTAAPYPPDGLAVGWTQPDGTELNLRVFGDEFYGRTETEDGRTVVFDKAENAYFYAEVSEDGDQLQSTGVIVDNQSNEATAKAARGKSLAAKLSPEKVRAIREANRRKWVPNERKEWEARVAASRQRRNARPNSSAPANGGSENEGVAPSSGGPQYAVTGSRVGLTILAQFPDDTATGATDPIDFPTTHAKAVRYSNEVGYNDDGNTGSVRDYFFEQSEGSLTYTQIVAPIVTLPKARNEYNYSDYPANNTLRDSGQAGRMVVSDAVNELVASGFDFSGVSLNGSNRIIATNIMFAGNTSGVWSEGLWPHRWVVSPQINVGTAQNPIYVFDYQITNAANSAIKIGTFCHENGHLLLKLPDLYDYGGESEGVGAHALMGSGNHLNGGRTPAPLNAYFKDVSGWANITDLTPSSFLEASLPTTGSVAYRIQKPGTSTEYFIVENRGNGDPWAAATPDKGIVIWHVDETVNGNNNEQMTEALHYEVSLEQADGDFDLENHRNRGDSDDYFDVSTPSFDDTTSPNAKWWDGSDSGIYIDVLDNPGANMRVQFGDQPPNTILIEAPTTGDLLTTFGPHHIRWSATISENVRIELFKGGSFHSTVASTTENDGVFEWDPADTLPEDDDYTLRIASSAEPSIEAFTSQFEIERVLFSDGFESGGFQPFWTVTGTQTHRTQVTSESSPYAGSYHVTMDSSSTGNYARNELTLSLDLEEGIGIVLEFFAKEFSDEENAPPSNPFSGGSDFDGVAISENGTTWYEVQPLRSEISNSWQRFSIDLDAALAAHGLTYSRNFKIRFNHYDNFPIDHTTTDGFAFDDIKVFGEIARTSTLTLNPASDTGSSTVDRITNISRPFFSGSSRESLSLSLHSDRDGNLGTFNSGGSGNWSFRPTFDMSDGVHNLTIAGDAVTSSPLSVTIDTRAPAATLNKAGGQADPAASGPVRFTAAFDEPVTDFNANEVIVSGTLAGGVSLSGGPGTYTATVETTGGDGNIVASVPGGVAFDTAGNPNTPAASSDNEVVVDGHGHGAGQATAFTLADHGGGNGSGNDTGWLFGSDTDSFSFSISSPKRVEITTMGGANTVGALFDTAETLINDPSADDNAGDDLNFLITRVLPPGDYRVDLTNGGGRLDWEYTVWIEISDPPLLINEVDSLTFDDDEMEFVELYDGGRGNLALDGKVLVFFDGTTDRSYHAIDLDGITTDANGYLVIGSDDLPQTQLILADQLLRNGPAAIALYEADDSDFPNGTSPTPTNLLDAVVYIGEGENDDAGLASLLVASNPQLRESVNGFEIGQSLQRIPNGIGELRSGDSFLSVAPTPGMENDFPDAPTLLDLVTEDDLGISSTDNLTSVVRPRLAGVATPGAIVQLESNHEGIIDTAFTARDGSFSFEDHGVDFRSATHSVTVENLSNSAASSILEVVIDTRRPTVTINQASGQADPTTVGPVQFEVTFDEEVHDFGPEDIEFLSSLNGPVSISGGPTMFVASIGMETDEGFLQVTIPEGAAQDEAGNPTRLATHTDNSVILDIHGSSEETSTALPLSAGVGTISGWVQPGDSDWFAIELADPRRFLVSTSGGVDTIGSVMDVNGNILNIPHLDDDKGDGENFRIALTLEAGLYFVEVAGRGQTSGLYTLEIDATEPPFVQPDLAVGRNASNTSGDDIYDDIAAQSLSLHSYYAAAANGTVTIENDGEVTDDFTVSAPPGDSVFGVRYSTWQDGNITADLITGRYRIENLAPGEAAPPIVAVISPSYHAVRQVVTRKIKGKKKKKKGKKKKKRKTKTITSIHWLRYSKTLTFRATSDIVEEQADEARIRVGTN